jgi:hypothetical protein
MGGCKVERKARSMLMMKANPKHAYFTKLYGW